MAHPPACDFQPSPDSLCPLVRFFAAHRPILLYSPVVAGQPIKKRADRKWRQGRNILGLFLAIALPLGLVMLLVTADLKQT